MFITVFFFLEGGREVVSQWRIFRISRRTDREQTNKQNKTKLGCRIMGHAPIVQVGKYFKKIGWTVESPCEYSERVIS